MTGTDDKSGNIYLRDGIAGDQITIDSMLLYSGNGIQSVQFADGTVWNRAQLIQLVNTPTTGSDNLYGTTGSDVIDGLGGSDYEYGDGGGDTFVYKAGYGSLEIDETDWSASPNNVLRLGPGITASQLIVTADRSFDLYLADGVTGDQIKIDNMVGSSLYGVQSVQFADGTILTSAQLIQLENAGTTGADNLYGTSGADVFDGLGGDDYEWGRGGGDTFIYKAGYGSLEIDEYDYSSSPNNVLKLGAGITASQLTVTADRSYDLYLADGTTGDKIQIDNMLEGSYYGVQSVQFADGTVLAAAQLIQLENTGTTGANNLYGTSGAEVFDGKGGNDYENGGGGGDTFIYNAGYGSLEIDETDYSSNPNNVLKLGVGITASQLTVTTDNSGNLYIADGIAGDQIKIDSMLVQSITPELNAGSGVGSNSSYIHGVQAVQFADGSIWTNDQLISISKLVSSTVPPAVAITSAGGATSQEVQTVSGTVTAASGGAGIGATVTLYDNGTQIGTATVETDGTWSTNVTLVRDGSHSLIAKDTDSAGNVGVSSAVTFTLDTVAPTVVMVSAGGLTNQPIQTVTGKVTAASGESPVGATVTLYDNGNRVGTAAVGVNGSWSASITLGEGANNLIAKNIDAVGNTGTSMALGYTLNTVPPIVAITSTGGVTNQSTQTISGTVSTTESAAGATVAILDSGKQIATTTVSANGSWSTQVTLTGDGAHSLTATNTDAAGNTGKSGTVTYTLNTVAPTVTITSSGGLTNQAAQTISGTVLAAGSTVAILDNGKQIATATVGTNGSWSTQVMLTGDGAHSLTATSTDAAGKAITSAAVTYTLDTVAPAVAITSSGGLTNKAIQTIAGTVSTTEAASGSTVAILDNGKQIATAAVGANGSWSTLVTLGSDGAHSLTAANKDAAGNLGTSAAVTYTLDTVAPAVAITSLGGLTNKATQTISGTVSTTEAAAGGTVAVLDNGTQIATATVSASGSWSTQVKLTGDGAHSLTATNKDAAGNIGVSTPVVFTVETTPTVQVYLANRAALDALGSITIADTWANVSANLDMLSADPNVISITLTDPAAVALKVTVTQAVDYARALARMTASWNYAITVSDTAANLSSLFAGSVAQLTSLHAEGVATLQATDTGLTVTATQAQALESAGLALAVPAGQQAILSDTSTALTNLFAASSISGLTALGITEVLATTNVSFNVAQTSALVAGGFAVAATAGHTVTESFANGKTMTYSFGTGGVLTQVKTTSANSSYDVQVYTSGMFSGTSYASYDNAYNASKQHVAETFYDAKGNSVAFESWGYNSDGSLAEVKVNGISGQNYASTDTLYAGGKPTSETWLTTGGGVYQTENWYADGSVKDIHVYTTGTFQGVAYSSYDNAYTDASPGFRNLETFYDAGGTVAASESFSPDGGYAITVGGLQTQVKTVHSDGTYDIQYLNVTGKPYTSYDVVYNAANKPTSETWLTTGGGVYQTENWYADGSVKDIHVYTTGTFQGVAYSSYDNAYTDASPSFRNLETFYDAGGTVAASESFSPDGGYAITVGGLQTQVKTVHSDGTYDIQYLNVTGKPYTSYDAVYNAANKPTSETWLTTGGGVYQTENWYADGSVKDIHVYTTGTFSGTSYASYDNAYNASKQHVAETFYDAKGNSVAFESWGYNSDGSLAEVKVNGISGQNYASTDTLYAGGKPTSETWLTTGGGVYQTENWYADGSVKDIHVYTTGTFQSVAYSSYDNAYTDASPSFRNLETFYDAGGTVAASESFPSGTGAVTVTIFGTTALEITGTSNENVNFDPGASGKLKLDASTAYTGAISGITPADTLDLANLIYGPNTKAGYTSNGANAGVLSVSNGSQTANIALIGNFMASSFTLDSDGHGTIVKTHT